MRELLITGLTIGMLNIFDFTAYSENADKNPAKTNEHLKMWFNVGEELNYDINWGPFTVGNSEVRSEWVEENGRPYIAISYKVKTSGFFNKIYPVDDFVQSIVDPADFRPVRFYKKIIRRQPKKDETFYFNYNSNMTTWTSSLSSTVGSFAISNDTRDIVSFLYYMRSQDVSTNSELDYQILISTNLTSLKLMTHEEEQISVGDYGKIKCLKVEPRAALDDILIEEGKVEAWITRDDRFILTRMHVKAPLGTAKIVLQKVSGPGNDSWVVKKEED